MGNLEKMDITEGTILNIDLTCDGEMIVKVRKEKDGPFVPLTVKELNDSVVQKGHEIKGHFLFGRVLSVLGLKVNPFKVYVNTGDRTFCYLFSDTFQYIGRCD